MKVVAFITDYQAVDRIIDHFKLMFVAEKAPPSRIIELIALMATAENVAFLIISLSPGTGVFRLLAGAGGFFVPTGSSGADFRGC